MHATSQTVPDCSRWLWLSRSSGGLTDYSHSHYSYQQGRETDTALAICVVGQLQIDLAITTVRYHHDKVTPHCYSYHHHRGQATPHGYRYHHGKLGHQLAVRHN